MYRSILVSIVLSAITVFSSPAMGGDVSRSSKRIPPPISMVRSEAARTELGPETLGHGTRLHNAYFRKRQAALTETVTSRLTQNDPLLMSTSSFEALGDQVDALLRDPPAPVPLERVRIRYQGNIVTMDQANRQGVNRIVLRVEDSVAASAALQVSLRKDLEALPGAIGQRAHGIPDSIFLRDRAWYLKVDGQEIPVRDDNTGRVPGKPSSLIARLRALLELAGA